MPDSIQLTASVAIGKQANPNISNPDGSELPFAILNGLTFTVTDISIQGLTVVEKAQVFAVSLRQNTPTGGTTNRWTFLGRVQQNVERSFIAGIKFSTPFTVANSSDSKVMAVVRLWGYFE